MRPAHAQINLQALRHNYRLARQLGGSRALAVIKADAYGHGAVRCAQALQQEADGFAVATIEEAIELREAGIGNPILLLEGFFEATELSLIQSYDLWCVVHTDWQLEAIETSRLQQPLRVWLKMDTGMHRVGFAPDQYRHAWQRLMACGQVDQIVMISHFARADDPDCGRTEEQLAAFVAGRGDLSGEISLRNSPALLAWPQVPSDWSRPGLMLYGVSPFAVPVPGVEALQPVLTLESRVIAVRQLAAGESVGYGAGFVCSRPTRVGVVAMGYADGYPRHAPNGTPVSIDGRPGQLIGRVSMDMLTVDLTDHPQSGLGSRVELWGQQVDANRVALAAGTIAYQMFCNLHRVARTYIG